MNFSIFKSCRFLKVFTYILKNNSTDLPSKKQTNKQNSSTLHLLKEDIHGYLFFPTFIRVILKYG